MQLVAREVQVVAQEALATNELKLGEVAEGIGDNFASRAAD